MCTECMVTEHRHPEHESRRLGDVEESSISTIKDLVTEAKSKMEFCEEASSSLENSLSELQMQRDNAKGLIMETYQSYKAILENRKVSSMCYNVRCRFPVHTHMVVYLVS